LAGSLPNLDLVNVVVTSSFLQYHKAGIDIYSAAEEVYGSLRKLVLFSWHVALSYPQSNHAPFSLYGLNAVGISSIQGQDEDQFIRRAPKFYEANLTSNDIRYVQIFVIKTHYIIELDILSYHLNLC
jgi:hypothetical protein